MGEATGTTAENLKQKLSQHIDATKVKLDALKHEISDMHEEDVQALEQKREDLRKRIDEQKDKARKMQADIASWKQEKAAHTKEAIGSWREQREVERLEARAERAEDYAVDMVSVASYDFDEAEQALFDAVAARYEADQAAAGPV
jgi:TolA-binding protein